jgi:hypothetical protein
VPLEVTSNEIVVCKPPGLASELPRDPAADSLVTRLRAQGFPDVRLVHRLDAPACGLMIVARTPEAAAHYGAEIAARRWQKVYVAEVAAPLEHAMAIVGKHKAYLSTAGRRARLVRSGGKPSFLTVVHAFPTGVAVALVVSGVTRGIDVDSDCGPDISGALSASATRESTRRASSFHSPHQSSSRTVGHTPSIMYDFALIGFNCGALRRHCPQLGALPGTIFAALRS